MDTLHSHGEPWEVVEESHSAPRVSKGSLLASAEASVMSPLTAGPSPLPMPRTGPFGLSGVTAAGQMPHAETASFNVPSCQWAGARNRSHHDPHTSPKSHYLTWV